MRGDLVSVSDRAMREDGGVTLGLVLLGGVRASGEAGFSVKANGWALRVTCTGGGYAGIELACVLVRVTKTLKPEALEDLLCGLARQVARQIEASPPAVGTEEQTRILQTLGGSRHEEGWVTFAEVYEAAPEIGIATVDWWLARLVAFGWVDTEYREDLELWAWRINAAGQRAMEGGSDPLASGAAPSEVTE